jgi:3-methylornithine--L-lysine ligase
VDRFVPFDVADRARLRQVISEVDLVFPAIEDTGVLTLLAEIATPLGKPVVLDLDAYQVSCSKLRSNALFDAIAIPFPRPYPACAFPVIAKPCFGSGSVGVRVFAQRPELEAFLADKRTEDWCVQQFVAGPSYSLEIVGRPGDYQTLQVTELFMDEIWDCRKVVAPAELPDDLEARFRAMTVAIAEALQLKGIMDVEVILADGKFYVLEIDARFPSQTPIAVYHSTGINMVKMLADLFLRGRFERVASAPVRRATLEHVWVSRGQTRYPGEHVMSQYGPLHVEHDFCGAERAVTSFDGQGGDWVATLIQANVDCRVPNAE